MEQTVGYLAASAESVGRAAKMAMAVAVAVAVAVAMAVAVAVAVVMVMALVKYQGRGRRRVHCAVTRQAARGGREVCCRRWLSRC